MTVKQPVVGKVTVAPLHNSLIFKATSKAFVSFKVALTGNYNGTVKFQFR